jgi:Cu+-exporting ATPase
VTETTSQVTLPVTGMTCANCVATIERNLRKLDGVQAATVNLASERASVEYDPARVDPQAIVQRIRRAGYDVAVGDATIVLRRLADPNDAARLERALGALSGVTQASVSLASSRARCYIPTTRQPGGVRRAVKSAGFEAVEAEGELEDVERRRAGNRAPAPAAAHRLVFTIPLFLLGMGRDLGIVPHDLGHAPWYDWLMFALATPVQFYVGGQYYVGAYKSLRNRAANMDVLIAMGSTAALLAPAPGVLPGHCTGPRQSSYVDRLEIPGGGPRTDEQAIKRRAPARQARVFATGMNGSRSTKSGGRSRHPRGKIGRWGGRRGRSSVDRRCDRQIVWWTKPGDEVVGATTNKPGMIKFEALRVGRAASPNRAWSRCPEAGADQAGRSCQRSRRP